MADTAEPQHSEASPQHTSGLKCECGETHLTIAYRVPLYLYVSDGHVDRAVVVDEPRSVIGGVVRCLTCDRFWLLDKRPDLGTRPAWEIA
jgi:hypothetical protein